MEDAVGLVDGLYPGAAAAGFRNFPDSATTKAPRISEVYTKGTLTLARLGREAPIAASEPERPRAPQSGLRERSCSRPVPGRPPGAGALAVAAPFAGDRHGLAGPVRAAR